MLEKINSSLFPTIGKKHQSEQRLFSDHQDSHTSSNNYRGILNNRKKIED
jgi:hypothetical protein